MAKSLNSLLDSLDRKLASGGLTKSRRKNLLKKRRRLRKGMAPSGLSLVSGGLPSLGKRR